MLYRLVGRLMFVAALVAPLLSCAQTSQGAALVEPARVHGEVARVGESELHGEVPCLIVIGSFVDRRRRDGEIGEIDGRPVRSDDIVAWMRGAFEAELENDRRMQVVRMDPGSQGIYVDAEVLSVYIVDEQETLIANVVMRLNYSMPSGSFAPELAYGSTTISEHGGEQPIRKVFEIALADLVSGTRDNLARACMTANNGRFENHGRMADAPQGR